MEKNISGSIRVVKMIDHHLAEFVLLTYIYRTKITALARLKRDLSTLVSLTTLQYSSTPTLWHVFTGIANFL